MCAHCGARVEGNGYTNHCPRCFWSKHVDVEPGDRAEKCGGLMEPVGVETERGEHKLTHRCTRCGFTRRQSAAHGDNFDALLCVSQMR